MEKKVRPICEIAREIRSSWGAKIYFGAKPYLNAMLSLNSINDKYMLDDADMIIRYFLAKTGISADISFTTAYEKTAAQDMRDVVHPKRPDTVLSDMGLEKPYFQVFSCKYGFQPNLSIMDLLFNEGPSSILYLKNGIRK